MHKMKILNKNKLKLKIKVKKIINSILFNKKIKYYSFYYQTHSLLLCKKNLSMLKYF